jgi:hypothetical protein
VYIIKNIRYRHDTLVGGYSFFFFLLLHFFFVGKMKKKFVGSGVKIRVGRVTGNQQLFFLGLMWPAFGRCLLYSCLMPYELHHVLQNTVKFVLRPDDEWIFDVYWYLHFY